jgi:hypothetical protein
MVVTGKEKSHYLNQNTIQSMEFNTTICVYNPTTKASLLPNKSGLCVQSHIAFDENNRKPVQQIQPWTLQQKSSTTHLYMPYEGTMKKFVKHLIGL